jgi:WD40 repeat protein
MQEQQNQDAYLDYLIKKQIGQGDNLINPDTPTALNQRKVINMKKIYQSRKTNYNPQSVASVGPMKPEFHDPTKANRNVQIDSEDESSDADSFLELYKEIDFNSLKIPFTNQTDFPGHTNTLVACTIDRAGGRMVTSANDNRIKFWDFHNMNKARKSFRSLDPIPGQPPKCLNFNSTGSVLLISGGNAKPKIMNRDGRVEFEFVKGDMYIRDHQHTKGHISVVTSSGWHPIKTNLMVTGSLDSTVRIWDVNANKIGIEQQLPSLTVIKCRNKRGMKVGVWNTKCSPDGSKILVACEDGSYQIFTEKNRYSRPESLCRTPYTKEITCLEFFDDSLRFVSRGQDNTLRMFDLRKFERPVYSWYELENNHEVTGACISPCQNYILTGTSNTKTRPGCLAFLSVEDGTEVTRIPLAETGKVTCVQWNRKLNQLFVGAGKELKAFYDPQISKDGAMLCVNKAVRRWRPEDFEYERPVLTPHALPLFNNDERHRRKNLEKVRVTEPELSNRPELPLTGPGRGGKVAGATTITQHLMRTVHMVDHSKREDPIEALLRYQKEAEENPEYINHAYKYTQPVRILDHDSEQHAEQKLMSKFKKCPKCGLKICQCVKKLI